MDDAPTTTRHTNHHHPMRAARTGKACDVPPSDIQLTHRLVCSRSLLYPPSYTPTRTAYIAERSGCSRDWVRFAKRRIRSARATADGTAILAIGGRAGAAYEGSRWEREWFP